MSPRYLLVVGDNLRTRSRLLQCLSRRTGLGLVFSNERIAALVNPACRCITVAEAGCILGSLFHRHGPAREVTLLTAHESGSIAASAGQSLLSSFWGGYVAAMHGPDSVRMLRDPSGTFSCYYATWAGVTVFASDAELLTESGVAAIDIDFEEIGRQLYRALVPAPATALRSIRELLAGFALHVPGDAAIQAPCWWPWDHVTEGTGGAEELSQRLSRTVHHCVQAWASPHRRLLLSVSGGLDSSIVAACLARAGAETVCLTMWAEDPSGDERPFASALCDRLGLPLLERPYRLDDIDIAQPLAPHLPRPRDRTQANAYERTHLDVAAEVGADAFITGNGGDSVFGYSQSASPVADRYLTEGLGHGTLTALVDVCRQTGCSLLDAVRQAWRLANRSPVHPIRPNPLFLHPQFVEGLGASTLAHPWREAPRGALPGKAAHIASILRVQPCIEAHRGYQLPVLSPLMSQPIIEACLQVPTWEWRAGGRDRSLARRAFAGELPPIVLDRRVKGTPSHFAARLLDHFRAAIRERLLGGRLAASGIVDAMALERVLAGERPVPDLERVRILELVNAEAWIDHWAGRRQASPPVDVDVIANVDAPPAPSAGPIP